jgi:hypothetical protein
VLRVDVFGVAGEKDRRGRLPLAPDKTHKLEVAVLVRVGGQAGEPEGFVTQLAAGISGEVRFGEAIGMPCGPLNQLDAVAIGIGEPARPEIVGTVR